MMSKIWWVGLLAIVGLSLGGWLGGCSDEGSAGAGDDVEDQAGDPWDDWEPVEPQVRQVDRFSVVWLSGSPYEMGRQHGELLYEVFAEAVDYIASDPFMAGAVEIARLLGILELAYENSYPSVIEECRGLVEVVGELGFGMDMCLALNFGDVLMEFIQHGSPRCTGLAVSGGATPDGRLYHGRILDWDQIDFILDNPVIFVRQPSEGIPHVYIGFPGNLSPYSGLNAAGISASSNEAHPFDNSHSSLSGRSHVQMLGQILQYAHTLEEAEAMIREVDHMSTEIFLIADGPNRQAAVFEMTARLIGVRRTDENGLVYVTNHFLAPETENADMEPTREANLLRYDRLEQLLEPDGEDSLYGTLDPATVIRVMRDRVNPWTGEESPEDVFDNGLSLATYGALFQMVIDPEAGMFWVATGQVPVPLEPFIGFSLRELLGLPDATPVEPPRFE